MRFLFERHARKKLATAFIIVQFILVPSCSADSGQASSGLQNTKRMECKMTSIKKSKAIIETILNDLDSSYLEPGGGGISEIKQSRTNVFVVSISQEERIDQFTYEVAVDDACKVKILKKEPATISFKE